MVEAVAQLVQGRPELTVPLVVGGLAAFPSLERPRVLFATVTEAIQTTQLPIELSQLQAELDRTLVGLGHRAEDHPFHPHLTLGRVKDATPDRIGTRSATLLELAERVCPPPLSEPFVPPSLILFESQQTEHGMRYLPLHTLPLSPTETR
jgi:2'-5' RNA ligase